MENIDDDRDIRNLIYQRLQMDVSISDADLQREAMELYGERYPNMCPNEWRHVVEEYTPMVREAAQPKAKEIFIHQYGMAAEPGTVEDKITE